MPKFVSRHSRLLVSTALGCGLFLLLPESWTVLTRILLSWDFATLLFLVLALLLMSHLDARQICERFNGEDEAAFAILIISVLSAVLTVVSIVSFLSTLNDVNPLEKSLHIALAALTVVAAWTLIPTMFTLHYADLYYSSQPAARPLKFPDTDEPVFWDFAYFSFTIAAACQTADVSTTQTSIRRVVIAHSVLSFFFNATVVGLAINVSAGLMGGRS